MLHLTESELKLVQFILKHLRSEDFARIEINRREGEIYVNVGKSVKTEVKFVGSVGKGEEKIRCLTSETESVKVETTK